MQRCVGRARVGATLLADAVVVALSGMSVNANANVDTISNDNNINNSVNSSINNNIINAIFHYVWLRDNCQCAQCLHPSTKQKLHTSGQIPLDVKPNHLEWIQRIENNSKSEWLLRIEWKASVNNELHVSEYPLSFLKRWNYSSNYLLAEKPDIKPTLWSNIQEITNSPSLYIPYVDWSTNDHTFWKGLEQLANYGLCVLKDVPTDNVAMVENVAKRFGCIRNTFYGTSWDVKSAVNSKNIAYTNLSLGLHMDLMYFEAPPGLQFLHMLRKSTQGGVSLFLDIYSALHTFSIKHPNYHKTLSTIPITYHYDHYPTHHYHFRHPLVEPTTHPTVNQTNNKHMNAFYAPPFQGPLETAPENVIPWYTASRAWEEHLGLCETFKVNLQEGECAIFHNRRVLHGREAFQLNQDHQNERWLRGTYVDWDDFQDRWRVYCQKYDELSIPDS